LNHGNTVSKLKINDAQVRPFDKRAVLAGEFRVRELNGFAKWMIKGITTTVVCQDKTGWRSPCGFSKSKAGAVNRTINMAMFGVNSR